MPAPQASQLAQLTKVNFSGKGIKLPADWSDMGNQFADAFALAERIHAPNPPSCLFHESTLNRYHVATAKDVSDRFEKYIDGICGTICGAIGNWLSMAMVTTAIINGPVGMVTPGGVFGPPLLPLILGQGPKATAQEAKYTQAIATAFGTAWQTWQLGLMGQLMWPAFAAFPGPLAPPMPCVPLPLIAMSSGGESQLSPSMLKNAMVGNLGDSKAAHAADLFDALAQAFGTVFQQFKGTTMVQNVLGTGPIPTFAPPFVPVGPVVAGTVIPTPGVFV
jgi:hypothetical protein